ncbi:MAG: AMP-binding protein, partial [Chloroflexi bacterium]|nr:AMP-binding protein [Chloroflexota bacterium]
DYPTTPPEITVMPHDLATISFTSGTAGKPQAICGTHLSLAHFWHWHTQTFNLSAADRFTMLSGLAHDPLLRDVFTPLVMGATLHIPDGDELLTPNYLADWLVQHRITAVHVTPAISQLITTAKMALSELRWVFLGGEQLTQQVVDDWRTIAPQATCVNFYGTTETPQAMGFHVVPAEDAAETAVIPLGHGIDGVQMLVLTPKQQLAGVGEWGQIGIRTPYLAQGYLGNEALTAAKFIPNPFVTDAPEADRIFLTGDNGRFLPNGDVEFLGREDGQLNLRGYRVERSEIEMVLASHHDVQRAVVQLHDQTLVAYIVGETAEPATLRNFLQQRVPTYMRPAAIVPLAQLPLTPNGKVDYRALPNPTPYLATNADSFVAPRTVTEIEIGTMWTDLLGIERVGIHDDFFALGGHSLLATQLISRMQTLFETAVPLTTFFSQPTIARLATFIDTAQRSTLAPPIQPIATTTPQPLSFAQQRLWFLDQLDETAFNIPLAMRLCGQLDETILAESINQIVQRHSSLRTTFRQHGDQPTQRVQPFTPITLHHIDLTHLPEAEQLAEAQAIATQESLQKFDLQADCLLRAHLLRLAATDYVLLITIHHIAADGWSLGVLLDELTAVYTALKEKRPLPLASLPVQYQDYAVWQRNWLQGDVLEDHLSYWREQLAHTPAGLALPTDYPRAANASFTAALHRFTLPSSLTQQLKTLGQQERSTLFMTLLAAFKILLYRYTGQTDIVVGSPIANRNQQEIEKLIGFFVNTLVLRTQLDGALTVVELLAQVREIALAAYTHQDMPFEKLVEALQPDRDLASTPFFQVMFILQNAPLNEQTLPDLTVESFPLTERLAQHDLTTVMWEADGTLQGVIEYKTALFMPETIAQICTHFVRLLT